MKVLSVFDGISCGRLALERAEVPVTEYYASEIDKYAIKVTQSNHPDTIQLGDMTKWREWDLPKIDILIAGFPCQAWSLAGKQGGDSDPRGALVHDLIDIWKHFKPKYFMFENVKMKKEFIEYINGLFGVEPILINSALVSAQNRNRLYWTNIPGIEQPEDKGILLKDIIESGAVDREKSLVVTTRVAGATEKRYKEKSMHQMVVDRDKSHCIDANYHKGGNLKSYFEKNRRQLVFERPCEAREFKKESICHHAANATDIKGNESIKRVYAETGKAPTLTTMGGGHREPKVLCGAMRGRYLVDGVRQDGKMLTAGKTKQYIELRHDEKTNSLTTVQKDNNVVHTDSQKVRHETEQLTYRKLTPIECCRLQTLPDDHFDKSGISNTQQYKSIGNGWTVDVVAHIFRNIKDKQ